MHTLNYNAELPVLVYGTLRPGHGNYSWTLDGRTDKEQNVLLDGFLMYSAGGCPYLVRGEGAVVATLVHITPEHYPTAMTMLDMLEGFTAPNHPSNHYNRILHTFTIDGTITQAWVYIAEAENADDVQENLPVIYSGDWNLKEYV